MYRNDTTPTPQSNTTTTRGTCTACGGKGYLIKAVKIGGGFARQDDVCSRCKGSGTRPAAKKAATNDRRVA